ncbi:MAG: bifunctional oligoribonuclease/PAP phosphatase NrnA [Endomicrobium sp.]|jgi:phosphoesterase RecJ-like protein|nr:bifunctional oligoribonuclease/PAP phosphatase NrnA [Endomicrobium sp.]
MKKMIKTGKSELKKLSEISGIIKQSKTFFIAGHVKPDGDSLGCALALWSMLKRAGKKASVYCADGVPDMLKFLHGAKFIRKTAPKNAVFDCAIILESVNFSRMGDIIVPSQAKKIINIDHHSVFTDFGDVNYIVPQSSSTAELVLKIFEYMKIKPSKNEADSLYTGLVTDTGRFQQLNTNCESHIAAAKLINYGVCANDIFNKVYAGNSLASLNLSGLVLSGLQTAFDGKIAYTSITRDMYKKSGAKEDDSEGIVNFGMTVKGVKVSCLFKEESKNATKVSFRSVKNFNVLEIVKKFGGGGHKNAAGCTLKAGINSSLKIIIDAFKEKFNAK